MFDKWLHTTVAKLPEKKRKEFFTKADGWLFHLHAFIQSSQAQLDARNRILGTSRLFDESIEQLEDLKALSIDQLTYIAERKQHVIVYIHLYKAGQQVLEVYYY